MKKVFSVWITVKLIMEMVFLSFSGAATLSFEPKQGKTLAYNQGTSVILLNTSLWLVEKDLVDKKVIWFVMFCVTN